MAGGETIVINYPRVMYWNTTRYDRIVYPPYEYPLHYRPLSVRKFNRFKTNDNYKDKIFRWLVKALKHL